MGYHQFAVAGTTSTALRGSYLLIPEFAREWVGIDKLKLRKSGMYGNVLLSGYLKTLNSLNCHLLLGAFLLLKDGKQPSFKFDDCIVSEQEGSPEDLEDFRYLGIEHECSRDYYRSDVAIRITKDATLDYDQCSNSECGQFL